MKCDKKDMLLYAVTDRSWLGEETLYEQVEKALKDCEKLSHLHNDLEYLISSGNDEIAAKNKTNLIEKICDEIFKELKAQGLTKYSGTEAEAHAYSVNNLIKNNDIRNLHILYGV